MKDGYIAKSLKLWERHFNRGNVMNKGQSYNIMDSLQASEYLRLAKGEERLGETCKTSLERKIMG